MKQKSNHVISRLKWDTVFDHKAQAMELQERLSDWSGLLMQQEIEAVFDQLCPPEQTWIIQSLDLDLGRIDLDNLELELSVKLRQQLSEKLTELILYSHQQGRQIEILDGKRSAIAMIRHFLQHGILPWNYQSADGSINQILAEQLQSNHEELIAMLKELGFGAEPVRQRMAWQLSETNMIKIMEGLEPNVGGQIILFSKELTRVQQKETVVQASSTADFKKNLWLWVLNYLLTDRGTVFNRVQFMKSSIVQMAAHYNMQYEQLFELIELAVAKLSSITSLQPDFITTLQLLASENQSRRKKSPYHIAMGKDYWKELTLLFHNQSIRKPAGKVAEFNGLVADLSGEKFFAVLKQEPLTDPQLNWLHQTLSFSTLLNGISQLSTDRKSMLDNMKQFYRALGTISISGITSTELQFILFKKVVRTWASGHWKLIAAENIWNELMWEVCSKRPVSKIEFLKRMGDSKLQFPLPLQLSLERIIEQPRQLSRADQHARPDILLPKRSTISAEGERHKLLTGSINVRNAGIVLINTYLSVLLSRLELINAQKKFMSQEARLSAVHYLQYAVTGLDHTEEFLLPLNKLLCGIPLSHPIKENGDISEAHKILIDGLITAVISHWPSIGTCSVEGFRGNWLVRDGLLTDMEDRWELNVEKRAYDLLIHRSPFSFSVIRYPWMDKPLYVNWPY